MTATSPTWETRLCDDAGTVSHEVAVHVLGAAPITYLDKHNNLSRHYATVTSRVTEPFSCTGSAHFSGHQIRCTSPAHKWNLVRAVNELPGDGHAAIATTTYAAPGPTEQAEAQQ